MRAIRRHLFQGAADNFRDLLIANLARSPGTRLVVEPVEPMLGKAPAPLADRIRVGSRPLNNRLVLHTIGRRQYNPCSPRQSLGRLAPSGHALQLAPLRFRQCDRHRCFAHRHPSNASDEHILINFSIMTLEYCASC